MKSQTLKLSIMVAVVALLTQLSPTPVYAQNVNPSDSSQPPPPPPPDNSQQQAPPPDNSQQQPPPPDYSQPPPPPPGYSQPPPPQPAYSEVSPQQAYQPPPPISYQSFYDELSPYGEWVNSPLYGYVWVPYAGPDFQPYATAGHWVLTMYGWTWVSDYPWGWATFHYGSWDFDAFYGWYWIPGYQWSPAWVSWRSAPGYYGWCPLGPAYAAGGYATYSAPPQQYVFVRVQYINSPTVVNYYEPRTQYVTYYNQSTVINNTYYDNTSQNTYFAGPRKEEVEKYTGTPVRPVALVDASSPEQTRVSGNEVRIFCPEVVHQSDANRGPKPAPAKVYQKSDMVQIAQRPVLTRPNQSRVAPFKPENIQRPDNHPAEQNRQQPPVKPQPQYAPAQQHPVSVPLQSPVQQHNPPVQQEQHSPAQQPQQHPIQQQQPQRQPQPASRQHSQQRPQQPKPHTQQKKKPHPQKQKPPQQQGQPQREERQ